MSRFVVEKLSEAAYLEGVHNLKCDALETDPDNSSRVLFIFSVDEEQGNKLLMAFGSSESFKFDNCVKHFKGKLFQKLKKKERA